MWASGAVAAALLVGVFVTGDTRVRQQRERRKAELAQQQFEAGMRITGTTLDQVRQQLQQQGIAIGN